MHRDICRGERGLCHNMSPIDGEHLLSYLRKVVFFGLSGDKFKFDHQGDGPARYNIIHFKQHSRGAWAWITVGQYLEGELTLNMSGSSSVQTWKSFATIKCVFPPLPHGSGQEIRRGGIVLLALLQLFHVSDRKPRGRDPVFDLRLGYLAFIRPPHL
ncbi:hypothetical protein Pmani_016953 [Petrolisthes manimaculis]|uniref:Receptor ligand binding region domain-containing protein n=1 Tax=Petrolisthes manimaculis TaxID=1843537 RepID=A0AAE1U679_9EUCA|nr:hypothetical protein Pmani_016953 [Petrolisthes manimaculis]